MESKIIIGLICIIVTTTCQGQVNGKYVPPDVTIQKAHSFALPALQIDSVFIKNLNTVLFNKTDHYMNSIISNPNNRWKHFYIRFKKKDSLEDCIVVVLLDTPVESSTGFFENDGYLYWFGGEVPPGIILETKTKRQFSYKDQQIIGFYDPPFWFFIYNRETGNIEVKEECCD